MPPPTGPLIPKRGRATPTPGVGRALGALGDDLTVVIVDEEELFRSGLAMILDDASGIRVLGSTDGVRALEMVRSLTPTVVLADVPALGRKSSHLLAGVSEIARSSRLMILTATVDAEACRTAVLLGVSALLGKDIEPALLIRCITAVAHGGVVPSEGVDAAVLFAAMTSREDVGSTEWLSLRERRVLADIVAGLSDDQIARERRMPRAMVENSVRCIFAKLGVATRVGAAVVAVRAGFVPPMGSPPLPWPHRAD